MNPAPLECPFSCGATFAYTMKTQPDPARPGEVVVNVVLADGDDAVRAHVGMHTGRAS